MPARRAPPPGWAALPSSSVLLLATVLMAAGCSRRPGGGEPGSIAVEVRRGALPGAHLPPGPPPTPVGAGHTAPPMSPPRMWRLQLAAALEEGDRLAVTTWGSSSHPAVPVRLVVRDRRTVELHLQRSQAPGPVTADMAATTSVVALDPEQVEGAGPLTVHLHDATTGRQVETLLARRSP